MPGDIINENGLEIKSITEIRSDLVTDYESIYGEGINVNPNSPDGQLLNIFAQAGIDLREFLEKINASFDPNQAEGVFLDQRVALNGIKRKAGTFTFTDITIQTDRAVTLTGLDSESAELDPNVSGLFIVSDSEGNEFYLLSTEAIPGAGTSILTFRSAVIGQVETTINTITNPVTIVAGVTSINNPTAANSTGQNEETDSQLRERREISVALSAIGYLDSIEAALKNADEVTTAIVLENNTDVTDGDGIPPHSIWAIVEGGDPDEIGEIIYSKKSSGSGMKGDEAVNVPRPNGLFYVVNYDLPDNQDLYIRFNLTFSGVVDEDDIKRQIVENVIWGIGKNATADTITCFVKSINSDYTITATQISNDGISWFEVVTVSSPKNRFQNDVSRITIT
jgi:uncharacterized phage protein gp47/JayE